MIFINNNAYETRFNGAKFDWWRVGGDYGEDINKMTGAMVIEDKGFFIQGYKIEVTELFRAY